MATASAPTTGSPPSIVSAPVRQIQTADGQVAYCQVGQGTPLVLIMGLSGTIDDWAPAFVDALAARYRVIVFNNAGIGGTAALPAPLTITAMAGQTSAFISALGLRRVDVLGWSMGGMIGRIRVPTLVADGTEDALNPVANDRLLAASIPGAQLALYPGAGHAYLFQDATTFVPRLEQTLG